jgi:hypothetical protein
MHPSGKSEQEGRGSTTKKKRKKEQEGTPTLMIVK